MIMGQIMASWLYPANIKYYDVFGAFSKKEVLWPIKSKVSVGDTVYFYIAAPHKQIGFITKIIEVDIEQEKIIKKIQPYFKVVPDKKIDSKPFMKLTKLSSVPLKNDSTLGLSALKQNGLKGMLMGPRNLDNNPELLEYIMGELK